MSDTRWLRWAQQLQAIAQAGLHYTEGAFDRERYEQIRAIAAEMIAAGTDDDMTAIANLYDQQTGYQTPKIDVRGVVFRDGRLLLVREKLDNGRWTLPGGWADTGDTPSRAVEREVREEAGYQTKAVKLLALYDRDTQGHPPYLFSVYKAFFLCELLSDEQNLADNPETDETGWFSEREIDTLDLSTGRVLPGQLRRWFAHAQHGDLPTEFD